MSTIKLTNKPSLKSLFTSLQPIKLFYTYKAEPECQVCMCNVKRKRVVNFTCHENHWVCIDCFESLCHKLWRHGRRPFCCFCNTSVKVRNSPNPTIQRRICIAVRYNQATQLYEFLTCLKGGCVS